MAEDKKFTLSNGEVRYLPADMPEDQARVLIKQEEDSLVDQPGWDWLRNQMPGVFNTGHEFLAGTAEGVGDLPNFIPNVINRGNEIYHLHADEPGAAAPEPLMNQFVTGPIGSDKTIAELNPQTPGYEDVRDYGRMTGTSLPAGLAAAVAVPAVTKLAGMGGAVADYFTGDPAIRDQPLQDYLTGDAPPGKWQQTAEFAAPLGTGFGIKGGRALARSPVVAKIADTAVKASGPVAAATTFLKTGSPTAAYVANRAAPATLRKAGQMASFAAPFAKPLLDAASNMSISDIFTRAVAPTMTRPDDPRRLR